MNITHNKEKLSFETTIDGHRAYVTYLLNNNALDIRHTFVPNELRGGGVAAALVKATYDYAKANNLKPKGTCSYAVTWLERHPEYHGVVGEDFGGEGTCAL